MQEFNLQDFSLEKVVSKYGLSGSTLKIIAIVTMFIDHLGLVVLMRIMHALHGGTFLGLDRSTLYTIYMVMRYIGRIAFPIFCFLLVEGMEHTSNKALYALRLFLFALISEVPFDLALYGVAYDTTSQNIYFTLLLGLLGMMSMEFLNKKLQMKWKAIPILLAAGFFALLGYLLKTDYGAIGVGAILMFYFLRKSKPLQLVVGELWFAYEVTAPIAFIPIALYNGKRGIPLQYFFYFFYPAHLLVLCSICGVMGIT